MSRVTLASRAHATLAAHRANSPVLEVAIPASATRHPCGAILSLATALRRRGADDLQVRRELATYLFGERTQTVAAITQRISRETDAACANIERLAKALAHAIADVGVGQVIVARAENLDTASLRIFVRLGIRLRRLEVDLVARIAHPIRSDAPGPREAALDHAWAAALRQGREAIRVEVVEGERRQRLPRGHRADFGRFQARLSVFLGTMAFDLAFDECRAFVGANGDPDEIAEALRIEATIHCNLGAVDAALQRLRRALLIARSTYVLSRLHYTLGLVTAKRRGQVEAARAIFLAGQTILGDGAETEEGRLCRAWHHNGLGLLSAMDAKAVTGDRRDAHFAAAMRHERAALSGISGLTGVGAVYLRYNLCANLVMLLEMRGNFEDARKLFLGTFERFARSDGNSRHWMTFDYRHGALLGRSGDWRGASDALDRALTAARACSAEQTITRIAVSLGGALIESSEAERAAACFSEALADAVERSDEETIERITRLTRRGLARTGLPVFASILDHAAGRMTRGRPCNVEDDIPMSDWLPSKLPSYCAFIDLLDAGQGINAHLTGQPGGRP